jgi:hypothetical protein
MLPCVLPKGCDTFILLERKSLSLSLYAIVPKKLNLFPHRRTLKRAERKQFMYAAPMLINNSLRYPARWQ